jgi:putative DNA primase/helicase
MTNSSALKTYTITEFLSLDIPIPKFLLHPWLPEGGLAMVDAKTGLGKTLLCIGSAIAISTGGMFLRFKAEEAQPVLYLDGEMPAHLMKVRLAQAITFAGNPNHSKFRTYCWALSESAVPDLSTPEGQAIVDAIVGDAKVIFIDNISAFCRTGKDNDAESWRVMDDWLLKHRKAGRAIVLVHHDGKNNDQRGTSKKEDKLDTRIQLVLPAEADATGNTKFEVHFRKHRHFWGKDASPFFATLTEQGWTVGEIASDSFSEAQTMRNEGKSYRDIEKATGISRSTLSRKIGG